MLTAPSMGRHYSTRVDGRKDSVNRLGIKMQSTTGSGEEGGEKSLLCDPGPLLRLGGREKRGAKLMNGMEYIYTWYVSAIF